MEILKISNEEMTAKQKYQMTKGAKVRKISECVGEQFTVKDWILYTDTKEDGQTMEILTILDEQGQIRATNSTPFKREFFDILSIMEGEPVDLEIISGKSKANRTFYTCTLI